MFRSIISSIAVVTLLVPNVTGKVKRLTVWGEITRKTDFDTLQVLFVKSRRSGEGEFMCSMTDLDRRFYMFKVGDTVLVGGSEDKKDPTVVRHCIVAMWTPAQ